MLTKTGLTEQVGAQELHQDIIHLHAARALQIDILPVQPGLVAELQHLEPQHTEVLVRKVAEAILLGVLQEAQAVALIEIPVVAQEVLAAVTEALVAVLEVLDR